MCGCSHHGRRMAGACHPGWAGAAHPRCATQRMVGEYCFACRSTYTSSSVFVRVAYACITPCASMYVVYVGTTSFLKSAGL